MPTVKPDLHSEISSGWTLRIRNNDPNLIERLARAMAVLLGLGVFLAQPAVAQEADNPIDPAADEVIRSMSDFLAQQTTFSFEVDVLYDQIWGGDDGDWDVAAEKITFTRFGKAVVRRPDRFWVQIEERDQLVQYHYDGNSITFSDSAANAFVSKPAPATIDETVKLLREAYESDPPLSDLLEANLYDSHMDGVDAASYFGKTRLRGKEVHHIAFTSKGMDWQIWIDAGENPVPVMLQILQRDQNFWPLYQAWFTKWEFGQDTPESMFSFGMSDDAIETQFVEDGNWEVEAAQ